MEDQVIKNPRKQIWRTNKQGNVIRGRNKSTGGRGGFKKGLKENKPGKKSVFDRLGLKTETNKDNNMNTRINFKKNIFQKKNKDHGFLKKNKSIREQDEFIKGNDSDEYMDDVSEDENSDNMESDGMGSEGVGMEDTELENVGIDDMGSDDVEHDVDSDGIRDAEYDSENMIEELEKEIYNNEERNNHSYKKNSRNDIKPVKEFVGGESVLSNIMQSRRKTNEERRKEEEMRQQYMKKLDEVKFLDYFSIEN
ncbi:hypothetical protein K502DRAFT_332656 [Neoconidiobolus thromboides FSU 785]|nr:hypothetical protein K502DRAFT_332656 [Neoconidiobolus thromboides FSU 785]